MESQELESKIKQLGRWYQSIDIGDFMTTRGSHDVKSLWNIKIKSMLPDNLENLRFLDIGCNAGGYSILAAMDGAEVIGVERSLIYFNQAIFIKECYEKLNNIKLNIKYIRGSILDLDLSKLGRFDFVLALAVLYHVGKHKWGEDSKRTLEERIKLINRLCKITDNIIVRLKGGKYRNVEYFTDIFSNFNFKPSIIIREGKRSLILYKKESI